MNEQAQQPIQARVAAALVRWPFLVALGVLLLNDGWLKGAYPGIVTGKLSDFAGIALVALPLLAAFPSHARTVYLALGAAFLWWKSPLSNGFIAIANELLPWGSARVVDYSDLIALSMLPLCRRASRGEPHAPIRLRRFLLPPVAATALLAIMATSMPPAPHVDLVIRPADPEVELPRAAALATIAKVAKAYKLDCKDCNAPERRAYYGNRRLGLQYDFLAQNSVHFRISWYSAVFGLREEGRARDLREALKREFTRDFKGLEAVEPLTPVRQY